MREAPCFVLNILSRQATRVLSTPGTSALVCKTLGRKRSKIRNTSPSKWKHSKFQKQGQNEIENTELI